MEIPEKVGYKVLYVPTCIITSPCLLWAVVASTNNNKGNLHLYIYDSRGSIDNLVFEFIVGIWQMISFTPAIPIPFINGLYVDVPDGAVVCIYYEPSYNEEKLKRKRWEFD
jgi:hypothetical protein